ncbi:ribbon-helix-helix domain-containing protein [Faecalicatena contorta]|nr:ribbon-helix-helix domain-containing protein [Faecalicatena contorta]
MDSTVKIDNDFFYLLRILSKRTGVEKAV